MTTKIVCLVTFLLLAGLSSRSQSIVGSWKKTATVLENSDGSSRDLQKFMTKSRPCLADVQYISRRTASSLPTSPRAATCRAWNRLPTGRSSGNTITVTGRKGNGLPVVTAIYTMTFSGNTVLFTHVYSEQEKRPCIARPPSSSSPIQRI